MSKIDKISDELINLAPGYSWLQIEEPNLRMLGGVPPDAMKYLAKAGLIDAYKLDGFHTEHGPNTILLNEDMFANGMIANLAEFPVLQMFYMQGMGLSFHPNFGKERPLIIGFEKQVKSQLKYFEYGNYGLNFQQMIQAGCDKNLCYYWYYMKARFGGNVDLRTIIDYIFIDKDKEIAIKPGVFLKRKAKNVYQINYKDKEYLLDINLKKDQKYKSTYTLPKAKLPKAKFAVLNTGTGDGWNYKSPCFGSLICHQKNYYLLDCEIFFKDSLKSLGLQTSKLAGLFMSHAHDDHMSGLAILYSDKKPIKLYATKLVYHSLMYTLMALLSISEEDFKKVFIFQELIYEKWNDIQGLEVIPYHSAHPIETSIFFFRVKDKNNYKVYAHLGDIAPLEVIKKFREAAITDDERNFYSHMIENYLKVVDLKKVDIGGGLIHGMVEDFANDASKKIILGHYHRQLTEKESRIGVEQVFGDFDILIP